MPVNQRLLIPRTASGGAPVVLALDAAVVDYDTVSLSWQPPEPVDTATLIGYTVEYSTDGENWSDVNA
jgi:hypothetical protein